MYLRNIYSLIKARLAEKSPLIQVMIGPRQVGKTTALQQALGKRGLYETADSPTPLFHEVIEQWWQEACKSSDKILAIDEVQKIVGWSEVIKKLWDKNPKKLKVVLTGSSALLMDKGLSESLSGRYELIRAEHWNYAEAKRIFKQDIKKFVEFGCYPGSMRFLSQTTRWAEYVRDSIVEPALSRDLLLMQPVEQPALLRQLFALAVSLPAQIVSLQKLQLQLQSKGSLPTLQHYLDLLGKAFLISGVQKFSTRLMQTKKSSPKLIIHDNALLRAFERPIEARISSEKFGRYFENIVGARFIEAGWDTFYWKDRDEEVDFIVRGPNDEKWAIEVKSNKINLSELKNLFKFCQHHPAYQPCLVSFVDQKLPQVKTLPVKEILSLSRIG